MMAFRGGMSIYLLLVAFLGDQFPTSVSDQAHGNPVQPGSPPHPVELLLRPMLHMFIGLDRFRFTHTQAPLHPRVVRSSVLTRTVAGDRVFPPLGPRSAHCCGGGWPSHLAAALCGAELLPLLAAVSCACCWGNHCS